MIWKEYKIDMDINFEYYKIFYYVAKYGNITKAATALGSGFCDISVFCHIIKKRNKKKK